MSLAHTPPSSLFSECMFSLVLDPFATLALLYERDVGVGKRKGAGQ